MQSTRRILLAVAAFMFVFSAIPAFGASYLGTVDFADANHGYLGGWYGSNPRSGFMSTTNDGGATWHAILTGQSSPIGIALNGTSTARAVSNTDDLVLSTSDAGAAWTRGTLTPPSPVEAGAASFSAIAKSSIGYVAVGKRIGTADGDVGVIYSSASGVSGWTQRFRGPIYPGTTDPVTGDRTPGPATWARMDAVAFAPDGLTGWAIGSEWSGPTYSSTAFGARGLLIYKTTNGGLTWVKQAAPVVNAPLKDIVVTDATHAYAVGVGRTKIQTTDGAAWNNVPLPHLPGLQRLDSSGIDAFDARHIVAVGLTYPGNVGGVQWTSDGGSNWSTASVGAPAAKLRSVSMISATKWIVVGDNETIGRTSNGGATWTWTTATPPRVTLTTPASYGSPSAVSRIVSGTSSDVGAGVTSVGVSILRDDGKYWRAGWGWVASQFWNTASTADGWDTWSWTWMPDPTQVGSHTYTVTARATDAVGLIATNSSYTITPTSGANGTISPSTVQTVNRGSSRTFAITPAAGYHIVSVTKDGASIGASSSVTFTNVTANHTIGATFARTVRPVTRAFGSDRYGTAAALARKGWDPTGKLAWTGVKHIIIANGEPGKESDPLSAAGLAGVYDAPVLVIQASKVPGTIKTVITEIAKKNPDVKIHIVGGTAVVPDARWNDIKRILGVSQVKDRFAGRDRYETSALMATRMIVEAPKKGGAINGVILIAGDNPSAFYDALAASPVAYAQTMPMLSVKKGSVPTSVGNVLRSAALKGKPRYAASSATYIGSVPAAGATRMTTSSNRFTAATQIAKFVAVDRAWTSRADAALASKLPDALTGGAFLGRMGGIILFTESSAGIQSTSKTFITTHKAKIDQGWVIGGTAVVPTAQETSFRNLLNP